MEWASKLLWIVTKVQQPSQPGFMPPMLAPWIKRGRCLSRPRICPSCNAGEPMRADAVENSLYFPMPLEPYSHWKPAQLISVATRLGLCDLLENPLSINQFYIVLPFEAFDQRASNIILKHFRLRGVCRTRDFWCFFFERWGRWGRWGCPHLCANWLVTDIKNCLAMTQELL